MTNEQRLRQVLSDKQIEIDRLFREVQDKDAELMRLRKCLATNITEGRAASFRSIQSSW